MHPYDESIGAKPGFLSLPEAENEAEKIDQRPSTPEVPLQTDLDSGPVAPDLEFVEKLEGRGQAGEAAFYKNGEGKQFLVKEDDPATCLAEALAGFASDYAPRAINTAELRHSAGALATIQPRVVASQGDHKIEPMDRHILGHKRVPWLPVSEESIFSGTMKEAIAKFSIGAKEQLANAIFASVLAGDESLHSGQFMVEKDGEGKVVGVKRIDFGAANRYAETRNNNNDNHPLHASKSYSGSGQLGKDYISHLLQDEDVKKAYLQNFAQFFKDGAVDQKKLTDVETKSREHAEKVIDKLGTDETALTGMNKSISSRGKIMDWLDKIMKMFRSDSDENKPSPLSQKDFSAKFGKITRERLRQMLEKINNDDVLKKQVLPSQKAIS